MASASGSFNLTPTPAIATERLVGTSNYSSWSRAVEMWFLGQGMNEHLTTAPSDVDAKEKKEWQKKDALLCSLMWQSIDVSLHNIFINFRTCYDIWHHAKTLYTNDT